MNGTLIKNVVSIPSNRIFSNNIVKNIPTLSKVNVILSELSLTLSSNNNTISKNTAKSFKKYESNLNKGELPIDDIPSNKPNNTSTSL